MLEAFRTQINVIAALTMRGMQTSRRKLNYGYAWAFFQPAVTILVLRLGQKITGLEPPGMAGTTFLVLGIFTVFTFISTMSVVNKATSNRGLTILPRVTILDLITAKAILTFITYQVLFWLFVLAASIYEDAWPPEDPLGVQVAFISLWLLGIAFAFMLNAVARYFPPISEFRKFIVRPLRWVSGAFFVITAFPTWLWPYFTWNPVLHVAELMRSYWFTSYTTPVGSLVYVWCWIVAMGLLGLSLERYLRRVIIE